MARPRAASKARVLPAGRTPPRCSAAAPAASIPPTTPRISPPARRIHATAPPRRKYVIDITRAGDSGCHSRALGRWYIRPSMAFSLEKQGITVAEVHRNASPAFLYEAALRFEKGSTISSTGALIAYSGKKTGRSPTDKRVVDEPETRDDVWWGNVNIKLDPQSFLINRERAIDYLNTRNRLYVVDGYAGWDPKFQLKIRVICARAYQA